MTLESTMICLDASEWMRNGDFSPSRLQSAIDGARFLCYAKLNANPESTVGLLKYGKRVEVMASPVADEAILSELHDIVPNGVGNFVSAVRVAALALKHRQVKHASPRIVVFVGSPVTNSERELKKLGQSLRRENVALDVVSVGESEQNEEKLRLVVDKANKEGNSHLLVVPQGSVPADVLVTSPIMGSGGGGEAGGGAGGAGAYEEYGGINPEHDPELAAVMQASLAEARAAEEAQERAAVEASGGGGNSSSAAAAADDGEFDMDDEIQAAIAMSIREAENYEPKDSAAQAAADSDAPKPAETEPAAEKDDDDEEQGDDAHAGDFNDPAFVNSLLAGLEGVDPNDADIQAVLRDISDKDKKDQKDTKKDEEKK